MVHSEKFWESGVHYTKSKYSIFTITAFSKARAVNFKDSALTKRIGNRLSTVLFYQPRVAVTSFFVYKVINDLESRDYLCISPILRIGLIHK